MTVTTDIDEAMDWIDAEGGYQVALVDGTIVCRNAKGKVLQSLPAKLRKSEVVEQLHLLTEVIAEHERNCMEAADGWMLRSMPVPTSVIQAVWDDPAWRRPLENAVVPPHGFSGADVEHIGFLRGVEEGRGVGLVNIDGESIWLKTASIVIPHPVLLPELDDFHELAVELDLTQGLAQLFREIYHRGAEHKDTMSAINAFADGRFEMLSHAVGRCRTLGYRIRGGSACCKVLEAGRLVEARYWIGSDAPEYEAFTGELIWVDERERLLQLENVGPVAFSEGMRMASAIYAGGAKDETSEA